MEGTTTTQQTQDVFALRGQDLIGQDGDKLGTIEEIYLDTDTNQPEWAHRHRHVRHEAVVRAVLHEEEPVVEKQAVPKERVRLDKEARTDERQVSDTLRKEQVEVDDSRGVTGRERRREATLPSWPPRRSANVLEGA